MFLFQNVFFGRRNNLFPYISFRRLAMFASHRFQNSPRKHKDPITGNSFIVPSLDRFPKAFTTCSAIKVTSFHYLRPGLIGERNQVITAIEKFKIKLSILHGCKPWTKSHHQDTRKLNEEFFQRISKLKGSERFKSISSCA